MCFRNLLTVRAPSSPPPGFRKKKSPAGPGSRLPPARSFNTLLKGYASAGKLRKAFQCVVRLRNELGDQQVRARLCRCRRVGS